MFHACSELKCPRALKNFYFAREGGSGGLLVAGGVIGNEANYFSNLDNVEEIIEMVLAVLLWPLVLIGVNINIGDVGSGGGDSEASAEGGSGGVSSGGSGGGGGN